MQQSSVNSEREFQASMSSMTFACYVRHIIFAKIELFCGLSKGVMDGANALLEGGDGVGDVAFVFEGQ